MATVSIISGESFSLSEITQDDENNTPFESGSTCTASFYKKNSKELILGDVIGTRAVDTDPFEIEVLPSDTADWNGRIVAVVTVTDSSGNKVGKEKQELEAEFF